MFQIADLTVVHNPRLRDQKGRIGIERNRSGEVINYLIKVKLGFINSSIPVEDERA